MVTPVTQITSSNNVKGPVSSDGKEFSTRLGSVKASSSTLLASAKRVSKNALLLLTKPFVAVYGSIKLAIATLSFDIKKIQKYKECLEYLQYRQRIDNAGTDVPKLKALHRALDKESNSLCLWFKQNKRHALLAAQAQIRINVDEIELNEGALDALLNGYEGYEGLMSDLGANPDCINLLLLHNKLEKEYKEISLYYCDKSLTSQKAQKLREKMDEAMENLKKLILRKALTTNDPKIYEEKLENLFETKKEEISKAIEKDILRLVGNHLKETYPNSTNPKDTRVVMPLRFSDGKVYSRDNEIPTAVIPVSMHAFLIEQGFMTEH